jgi:hypothetical protein
LVVWFYLAFALFRRSKVGFVSGQFPAHLDPPDLSVIVISVDNEVGKKRRDMLPFQQFHWVKAVTQVPEGFAMSFDNKFSKEKQARDATTCSHLAALKQAVQLQLQVEQSGKQYKGAFIFEDDAVVAKTFNSLSAMSNFFSNNTPSNIHDLLQLSFSCFSSACALGAIPKINLHNCLETACPSCEQKTGKEDNMCDALQCGCGAYFCFFCGALQTKVQHDTKGHGEHYKRWPKHLIQAIELWMDHWYLVDLGWCCCRFDRPTALADPKPLVCHDNSFDSKPKQKEPLSCNEILQQVATLCKNVSSGVWLAGRFCPPRFSLSQPSWEQKDGHRARKWLVERGPGVHLIRFDRFTVMTTGAVFYPPGEALCCLRALSSLAASQKLGHIDQTLRKNRLVKAVLYPSPFGVCDRMALQNGQVVYSGNSGCRDNGHGAVSSFEYNKSAKKADHINSSFIPSLLPPADPKVVRVAECTAEELLSELKPDWA